MKTTDDKEVDLLKGYLNRATIEEAPEGFTGKVMSAISVERIPLFRRRERIRAMAVPAGIVLFMITLVVLVLMTDTTSDGTFGQWMRNIVSMLKFPQVKHNLLPAFDLPVILFYISLGMIALGLLDLVLGRYFHNKQA